MAPAGSSSTYDEEAAIVTRLKGSLQLRLFKGFGQFCKFGQVQLFPADLGIYAGLFQRSLDLVQGFAE